MPKELEKKYQENLGYFFLEDHYISDELYLRIKATDSKVVSGENKLTFLMSQINDDPYYERTKIEEITEPGVGGTIEQQIEHRQNVLKLFLEGKSFWTTDGDISIFYSRNESERSSLYYFLWYMFIVGISAISGILTSNYTLTHFNKRKFSRRDFLKLSMSSSLSLIFSSPFFKFLSVFYTEKFVNQDIQFLTEIMTDPEFKTTVNARRHIRDLVMLQNHLHMTEITDCNNSIFFAGLKHADIKNLIDDKKSVEYKIEESIDILFSKTFDLILSDKNLKDGDIIHILLNYAQLFSQPLEININGNDLYSHIDGFYNREKYVTPNTATIFVKRAIKLLNSGLVSTRKKSILEELLNNILRQQGISLNNSNRDIKKFLERNNLEENTKFFETEKKLFDYGLSIANFELVYDISHLNQGYLAVGIFSGRVVPITYYYEDKVQYLVFTINGSDLIKINK